MTHANASMATTPKIHIPRASGSDTGAITRGSSSTLMMKVPNMLLATGWANSARTACGAKISLVP